MTNTILLKINLFKYRKYFFILFLFSTALAQEKVAHLDFGAGVNNAFCKRYLTGEVRAQYKFAVEAHHFRPLVGMMVNFYGDFYLYTGFDINLALYNKILFCPGFALGYWHHGNGRDLGYPLEFRSGVEVGWQFENQSRIGIHFYHISNAGLGKRNPGSESFVFFYAIPIKHR